MHIHLRSTAYIFRSDSVLWNVDHSHAGLHSGLKVAARVEHIRPLSPVRWLPWLGPCVHTTTSRGFTCAARGVTCCAHDVTCCPSPLSKLCRGCWLVHANLRVRAESSFPLISSANIVFAYLLMSVDRHVWQRYWLVWHERVWHICVGDMQSNRHLAMTISRFPYMA